MRRPFSRRALTRLQLAGAALLLLGSAGVVAGYATLGERAYLIRHGEHARWITPRQVPRVKAIRVARDAPPAVVFSDRFVLDDVPERAVVHVRALRELQITVNGRPVPLAERDPRRWRRTTSVEVAPLLAPGPNRIEARVANPEGPPLLQLWIEGLPARVATGPTWFVAADGARGAAVVAHDVRRHPQAESVPGGWEALGQHAPLLGVCFLLCAALAWRDRPLPTALAGAQAPRAVAAALALVWVLLYAKSIGLPPHMGFDAEGHLAYVRLLAEERRLPLADEGWATFHPPLFHVSAAFLREVAGTRPGSALDQALLHLLPVSSGFACALLAGLVARGLHPDRPALAAVAIAAAGLLPMNLYVSSFVSNEAPHAALMSAAVWLACGVLLAERAPPARLAALAVVLALAALTKYTATVLAPLVLFFVGAKLWLVEGRPLPRVAALLAGLALLSLLLGGWPYWRHWQAFGTPFVSNYSLPGVTYWIPPGFHTPDWYLGFGEVLSHPFFASFHSFWDGLYSTLWGDGTVSGRAGIEYPSPWWRYDYMAAAYPLALPATAIGLFGLGLCAARALRGEDLRRRLVRSFLLVLVWTMGLALLGMTLRYPHYGLPKAFYALPAIVPLAVAWAAGFLWLDERLRGALRPARALLHGSLGALVAAILLGLLG
jgi:hypothetical protein